MRFSVRVAGVVVAIVLASAACGSTKTVAVPDPTVLVTPTPTVTATASPAPQRDVADPKAAHQFVELRSKGEPQAYALVYADSGAVNLHYLNLSEGKTYPTVSSPLATPLLVGTYVTVHCFERGDTVVNNVGRSSDVWDYVSLGEGIDGFASSVFIDRTSGNTSWVVPACPAGFGSDPKVAAEPAQ